MTAADTSGNGDEGTGSPSAPHPLRVSWTPGPWVLGRDKTAVAAEAPIIGNIICEAPEAWPASMENWPANARLIAASPDLVEALKEARRYVEAVVANSGDRKRKENYAGAVRRIDAALSKAGV